MLGHAGQHLAAGDGGVKQRSQRGMALGVVGVQRLFDPGQVQRLDQAAEALGGDAVPLLVGVDHQVGAAIEQAVHRLHPRQVGRGVGLADLDLDAADAAGQRGFDIGQQLRRRRRQEAARGVVAGHAVAVRAQQLGQRQLGAARLAVPQRDVERGDGLGGQAAAADRGAGPDQLVPDPGDVVRVFAEQGRRDLAGVGIQARTAGTFAVAEAAARLAFAGLDLGEQQRDLGQRLLPAGQHLGVGDRRGQRQQHQRQADPGNAILAGHGGLRWAHSALIPPVWITCVHKAISDLTNSV